MKRLHLFLILVLLTVLTFSVSSFAAYPEHNINCVLGFSPGGPTDVIARGSVPILQEILGVGIAITNMPGAAGAPAAKHVLDQPADGYTFFYGSETMSVWQTMGTMDISPLRDFDCIKLVAEATPVLAVPPKSQFNSAEEFVKYAQENPGKLRIGTAGPGTVPHVSGLMLQQKLGCKFTFVPYQGGAPAITAVMGAQVDATIEMVQSMVSAHQGGQLKIITSFTNVPIPGLEEVPPIGQIYPVLQEDLPYGPYFGPFVKKGTPQEVIDVLKEAMEKVIVDQRWIDYTNNLYLTRINYSGEEAIEYLENWTAKAAWLLYNAGAAAHSPTKFGIKNLDLLRKLEK